MILIEEKSTPESEREFDRIERARTQFVTQLSAEIYHQWTVNSDAKREIEKEDLASLRQKKGEYEPRKLAEIRKQGGSEIFMKITAVKCHAALSWLSSIYLSSQQVPHGLETSKKPQLPFDFEQLVRQETQERLAQLQQSGREIGQGEVLALLDDVREQVQAELKRVSDAALEEETNKIEDQYRDGGFYDALPGFLDDFTTFKNAFLEGPYYRNTQSLAWDRGEMIVRDELKPFYRRVSPFDVYPAPEAETISDGRLIVIDHYTRAGLKNCTGVDGYHEGAINEVLRDFDRLGDWLADADDSERYDLEEHNTFTTSDASTVKAIHIWGEFSGLSLLQWGLDCIEDPMAGYDIEAIMIDHRVIMCRLNNFPGKKRHIYTASMFPVPGSFWGQSLPERIADIQQVCNAAARAMVNNMAMASGPQVGYFADRISDDALRTGMHPWKEWEFDSDVTGGQVPIAFFQPAMHAPEIMGIYNNYLLQADEISGIPRYAYGSEKVSGAAATASGLAQLMEAHGKGVQKAASYIDKGLIEPCTFNQFLDNQLINPSERFIGDVHPVAKGASAISIKGAQEMRRNEFLQITANPVDLSIIGKEGRAKLLKERTKDLGWQTSNIVQETTEQPEQQQPSPEEIKAKMEQEKMAFEKEENRLERESREKIAELNYKAAIARANAELAKVGITGEQKKEEKILDVKGKEHLMAQQYKAEKAGGRDEVVI